MMNCYSLPVVYDPQPFPRHPMEKYLLPPCKDQLAVPAMPRNVWFHPEPVRLARQDSRRRGACTEPQLFPAAYIVKPTGLELGNCLTAPPR